MRGSTLLVCGRPREAHGAGHGHGEVLLHRLLQSPCVKQSYPSVTMVHMNEGQITADTMCCFRGRRTVCFA